MVKTVHQLIQTVKSSVKESMLKSATLENAHTMNNTGVAAGKWVPAELNSVQNAFLLETHSHVSHSFHFIHFFLHADFIQLPTAENLNLFVSKHVWIAE